MLLAEQNARAALAHRRLRGYVVENGRIALSGPAAELLALAGGHGALPGRGRAMRTDVPEPSVAATVADRLQGLHRLRLTPPRLRLGVAGLGRVPLP